MNNDIKTEFKNEAAQELQTWAEKDIGQLISNTLEQLNLSFHLAGYDLIAEAVEMVVKDKPLIRRITTVIYVDLAKKHDITTHSVERRIRYAIGHNWKKGNTDVLNEIFDSDPKKSSQPTNREYIAAIAERVRRLAAL